MKGYLNISASVMSSVIFTYFSIPLVKWLTLDLGALREVVL